MSERITAAGLLGEAARLYDDDANGLRRAAASAWWGGFASGGRWMHAALAAVRDGAPAAGPRASLQLLGVGKYAACAAAAGACVTAAALITSPVVAALAVPAFYAVEAQMVFLFPVAIDGSHRPFADARSRTAQAGGTLAVMRVVLPIAAVMIFGGLFGRGFTRSWCLGCLAICVWYERVRARPARPARLELGNAGRLSVRHERVDGLGLDRPVRLLYVSDLHLGHRWTDPIGDEVAELVAARRPDAVLLGGDLADNRRGIEPLASLVRRATRTCPLYAVAGNHDRGPGIDRVRRAVESAGGMWFGLAPVRFGDIELHAPGTLSAGAAAGSPARVLVAHDPWVFPCAADAGYDVVFAGHLHGGQCVLATVGGRDFPGALLSRWTGARFARGRCTLLVSRGAADTLPVRWDCPREVILCTLS